MRLSGHFASILIFAAVGVLAGSSGCGSSGSNTGGNGPGGGSGSNGGGGNLTGGNGGSGNGGPGSGAAPCTSGLCTQVHSCPTGSTTVGGKVFDPAGKNPLYNIVVYIPNSMPQPLMPGPYCTCDQLYTGDPITTALTGPDGTFQLQNVPDGANIPIVVQIGKWRMQFTLPNVGMCTNTAVPDGTLHLPRNHTEGDIPNIAISTGGADTLECLLGRVGIEPGEYGGGSGGSGRLHIFNGDNGADTNPSSGMGSASSQMWSSKANLSNYDIVILSCEGHETTNMNQQALYDYTEAGGRVFASHFHYAWFNTGPYAQANLAQWRTGSNDIGNINADILTTYNGAAFPKGQAMKQWLGVVNALGVNGAPQGELPIQQARHNSSVTGANANTVPWIVPDQNAGQPPNSTQYFSVDTPLAAPANQKCGRIVYSDLHVGAAAMPPDYPNAGGPNGNGFTGAVVPADCSHGDLSPQEKALEFMLFDLASCSTSTGTPTAPPPAVVK
jgi:hypothetical protein